jgi:6-phosphogluconolactonase (cycloisomerase 2 family)
MHGAQYFWYVVSNGANYLSGYSMNPTTGALTPVPGSPFATGAGPFGVVADPTGRFVYVANEASGNVSGYAIDPSTGTLTAIAGSPFAVGINPLAVTVDPMGRFAYVGFGTNIAATTIDQVTGALTTVAGSPFAAGAYPAFATVDPTGRFVYTADDMGGVSAYTINPATGALAAVAGSPFPAGTVPQTSPYGVAVDPTGRFAFVADNFLSAVLGVHGRPYERGAHTGSGLAVPLGNLAADNGGGSNGTIRLHGVRADGQRFGLYR